MNKAYYKGISRDIIVIFIVFEVFLILYINTFSLSAINEGNKIFAERTLEALMNEKCAALEDSLRQVQYEVENLGMWASFFLDLPISDEELQEFSRSYRITTDQIITDREESLPPHEWKERRSKLIFTDAQAITNVDKMNIINSEKLNQYWHRAKERLRFTDWMYLIIPDGMIRIYPYTYTEAFSYAHDFKKDVYYYSADLQHNPEKKAVWTKPYIDYLGKGWVVTCSYPIFKGNALRGILSIDLKVDQIEKSLLNLPIKNKERIFLVDTNGSIIFNSKKMNRRLPKMKPRDSSIWKIY